MVRLAWVVFCVRVTGAAEALPRRAPPKWCSPRILGPSTSRALLPPAFPPQRASSLAAQDDAPVGPEAVYFASYGGSPEGSPLQVAVCLVSRRVDVRSGPKPFPTAFQYPSWKLQQPVRGTVEHDAFPDARSQLPQPNWTKVPFGRPSWRAEPAAEAVDLACSENHPTDNIEEPAAPTAETAFATSPSPPPAATFQGLPRELPKQPLVRAPSCRHGDRHGPASPVAETTFDASPIKPPR